MTSVYAKFTHGGNDVTLYSAKMEAQRDIDIIHVPIPAIETDDAPEIALMNMKSFKNAWIINGFIVKRDDYSGLSWSSPWEEFLAIYEMSYKTSTAKTVSLTYRDNTPITGMIKKVQLVDSYSGDFDDLLPGEAAYELQIMFLEGKDITNL